MKDERNENDAFPLDTGLGILIKDQNCILLYYFYARILFKALFLFWYLKVQVCKTIYNFMNIVYTSTYSS